LDIAAQTRAVLENIQAILKEAGADLTHVVDMTVFLVDMRDYQGMHDLGPPTLTLSLAF
jgi:2-aminomuconate deaminase